MPSGSAVWTAADMTESSSVAVRDHRQSDPAVHAVDACVAIPIHAVPLFQDADAPFTARPPFLPLAEPALCRGLRVMRSRDSSVNGRRVSIALRAAFRYPRPHPFISAIVRMVRSTPKLVVIAWESMTFATYAAFFRLANRFPCITGLAVAIAAIVAISLGPYIPARRSESR